MRYQENGSYFPMAVIFYAQWNGMYLTGRDFQEREEEIYLDFETLTWHPQGETQSSIPNMTPERSSIINAIKEIGRPCKPTEIAAKLGKDNKVVGNLLLKMQDYYFVCKSKEKNGYWELPDWLNENKNINEEIEIDEIF